VTKDAVDAARSPVQFAREYLVAHRDLQVATVSANGRPWIFTCWYAANDRFEVVFMSKDYRRHSQDMLATGYVAATAVYRKNTMGEPVQSVTIEGRCHQLGGDDVTEAYARMLELYPKMGELTPDQLADKSQPDYLWKIEPAAVVLFDELNFPAPDSNPRQEITEW
jgi:uncharacterized protein YhbP (UPF0306 family)